MLTNFNSILTNVPSGSGGATTPAADRVDALTVANQAARLALTSDDVQPLDLVLQSDTGALYVLLASDPSQAGNWGRLPGNDASLITTGTLPAGRYTSSPTTNALQRYNGTFLVDSAIVDSGSDIRATRNFSVGSSAFSPSAPLHARSTSGDQLCLDYSSSVKATFTVNSSGYFSVVPSGLVSSIRGTLRVVQDYQLNQADILCDASGNFIFWPNGGTTTFRSGAGSAIASISPTSWFIANTSEAPSSNPTGGGYLYVESGALKFRGSSGTVTTLGPA